MKFKYINIIVVFFGFLLFYSLKSYGEGTKQILQTETGHGKLQIYPGFSTFAWYTSAGVSAEADYRLYIHISAIGAGGEKIYYGFGDPLSQANAIKSDVLYRILDPSGNIVVGGTLGSSVPLAGAGHINTLLEAQAGPSAIVAGGYSALSYTPLAIGDYFIEFHFPNTLGDDRRKFKYFDVTVANSSNEEKPGRLWSKAWQLTADDNGLAFNGTFFIYSNDGIVTSVNSNGMAPFVFTIACNQYGCFNTNNFINDRRSVSGNHIIPQYKIFLNNPDVDVYPTGIPGEIIPPIEVAAHCDGTADITIYVTKDGNVDLLLNINPAAGQQAEDVPLGGPVYQGQANVFHWSGMDGLGQPVTNNIGFNIIVTYVNGLTNLPISDIDENPNGFIIGLVRPTGPVPPVFWDDLLVGGSANTSVGCDYTLLTPPAGCHTVSLAVGNNNTINTWWYAVTTVPYPVSYIHKRAAQTLTFQQPATSLCANMSNVPFSVFIEPNTSIYHWSYTGTGATITQVNPGDNFVTITFASNATSGFIAVFGTNDNCPDPGPIAQLAITIKPTPNVQPTPASPLTICNNTTATIDLASNVPGTINNTTFNWTAVAVDPSKLTFPNPSGSTPNQISQAYLNSANVTEDVNIAITPVSLGCSGSTFNYLITVNPTPGVLFTSPANPQELCSGSTSPPIVLSSNVLSAGVGYSWTVACNSINVSNCPPAGSAILLPEIPAASPVNLTGQIQDVVFSVTASMNASGNQVCNGPSSDFTIHINPKPALGNTILSQDVCSGQESVAVPLLPIPLPPAIVSFDWIAAPSDITLTGFTASATNMLTLPAQTISNPTGSAQYVDYVITPVLSGGSSCVGDPSTYRININPSPDVIFTTPTPSICSGSMADVYFSSSFGSSPTYAWMVVLPLPPTVTMLNTGGSGDLHEIISNSGNSPVNVQISVTPTSGDGCTPTTPFYHSITINPNPAPVLTASPITLNPCGNSMVTYTPAGAPQLNHSYQWTVAGGTPVAGGNPDISVIWGNSNLLPGNSVTVMESVTYAAGVVCSGSATQSITLNLTPDPAGAISGPSVTCLSLIKHYTVAPINNADSYTWWYVPSAGVSITNNGTSADVSFTAPAISGNLFVKGNKSGCASGSTSPPFAITINPLPYVALTACNDPVTTTTSKPFTLKGGVPAGGQYYIDGNPAVGNMFTPSGLSVATHLVTYTYTDVNACINTSPSVPVAVIAGSNLLNCPATFRDSRDQQLYSALTIGGRCWMRTNLNYPLQKTSDLQPQSDNCSPEKYCASTDANCTSYGGLYQWDELMQYQVPAVGQNIQGLCPPEWHVPTAVEWQDLINVYQGNGIAAGSLKNPLPSGFSAVLNGIYYLNTTWSFTDASSMKATMFWTSSLAGGKPVARGLNVPNPSVSYYESSKANSFPVRCVKD
ncbi:MAG: hypothetical protein NT040_15135 [Bacteroidetes bacterium]|nr:hypothetical protein [Bacteroidota bacterium]